MSRNGVPIAQNESRLNFSDLLPGDILLFRPFSPKTSQNNIDCD